MMFASDYLEIRPADRKFLDGLRWSTAHAYVEHGDGKTFAHVVEVFSFVEGFGSQRPLMHFGLVLHFLYLLRQGRGPKRWHDFSELSEAWNEAGRPARTAGVFCALLCQNVPPVSDAPQYDDLAMWLTIYSRTTADADHAERPREEAPFTPEVFEATIALALEGYTREELLHWFRHGHGPIHSQGEKLARELLAIKPPKLENVLAELNRHDRLSGAVPFVARLVSALTLPPRRLIDRELPLGGYADVTTRGQPEQILVSQFALDEVEFVRRFAENELLFYRREEPASRTREELIVLLDQGVRTWGRVRLVLAAGLFALGQYAHRRRLQMLLASTSNGGKLVDPLATPVAALGEMLANSELSANPGLALEHVLSGDITDCRDVVLLTHPRNLAEPDVLAAVRTMGAQTRLFALAVDGHGEVVFDELCRGGSVRMGQFRLDLDLDPPLPAPIVKPAFGWTGDVEPIGFPFRFGLASNLEAFQFAFDYAGEWVLAVAPFGMLCAGRTDGSSWEMLPRPLVHGAVFTDIDRVIGVSGGFVLVGCSRKRLVAVHYDFVNHQVNCHEFAVSSKLVAEGVEWRYSRRKHMLILRVGVRFWGLTLTTGRRTEEVPEDLVWRPARRDAMRQTPSILLPPLETEPTEQGKSCWAHLSLALERSYGTLHPSDSFPPGWEPFTPLADGRVVFAGTNLKRAECKGDILAVLAVTQASKKYLWLFQGPGGETITRFPIRIDRDQFTLSEDGKLIAIQRGHCQLEIRGTRWGDNDVRCVSPVGRFHNNVTVELGDRWLKIMVGGMIHQMVWNGEFRWMTSDKETCSSREELLKDVIRLSKQGLPALAGRLPDFLKYDTKRFRMVARRNLIAIVDAFGEVFLFDHSGELVCACFVFRQQFAAWMPDGTCYGSEALLGRPATPDAKERIGQALLAVWQRGERVI